MIEGDRFVLSPCFNDVSISRYAFKKVLERVRIYHMSMCVIKVIYFDNVCSRLQD
jgi:hypothetical protein